MRALFFGMVLALLSGTATASAANELKSFSGTAADFAAQDLQGRPVRFSAHRGKVVLLNFWATWCPPCRKEMPAMERLHRAYRERGLVVLAVSEDTVPPEEVKRFAALLGLTFPVWYDRSGEAGRQYRIPGVPTSYLVTHDGQLAWRVLGEYDWSGKEAIGAIELLLDEAGK